ncbi:MAG: phenylalanine--tRNA ligase subunit alpha, partial [Candidatus Neomarinimicrobiota bacterium]|nr:phenylalanine--tRNA ligase subunit alpha [Candidatus Neomarinimicrobiota bacterium]
MPLKEQIESVRNQFLADIESFPQAPPLIDQLKSKYLGRKGLVAQLFSKMSQFKSEDRPRMGKELNSLKIELTRQFENKVASIPAPGKKFPDEAIDFTLPGKAPRMGSVHILEQT